MNRDLVLMGKNMDRPSGEKTCPTCGRISDGIQFHPHTHQCPACGSEDRERLTQDGCKCKDCGTVYIDKYFS